MSKLYNLVWRRRSSEDGQSALEFALVFPIFLFFVGMVLFASFYTYGLLSVENAARNAARVACVEYKDVLYDEVAKVPKKGDFLLSDYDRYFTEDVPKDDPARTISIEEEDIIRQVNNTLSKNFSDVHVKISYTYDDKYIAAQTDPGIHIDELYNTTDRYKNGDVQVIVEAKYKMVGATFVNAFLNYDNIFGNGSGSENKDSTHVSLKSQSVYKVENVND